MRLSSQSVGGIAVGLGFGTPDDWGEDGGEDNSLGDGFVVPASVVDCEAKVRRAGGGKSLIGRDRFDIPRYLVY